MFHALFTCAAMIGPPWGPTTATINITNSRGCCDDDSPQGRNLTTTIKETKMYDRPAGEKTGEKAGSAMEKTRENLVEAKDATKEKAQEVAHATKEKAKEAKDYVEEKAQQAGDYIKEKTTQSKDSTKEAGNNMQSGYNKGAAQANAKTY